jgi:hypothetical protein
MKINKALQNKDLALQNKDLALQNKFEAAKKNQA